MKLPAAASKQADPYEILEAILKIAGRSWLSEEWRLEDIRILAQEAVSHRPLRAATDTQSKTRGNRLRTV